jgi:hypothetical protein
VGYIMIYIYILYIYMIYIYYNIYRLIWFNGSETPWMKSDLVGHSTCIFWIWQTPVSWWSLFWFMT